MPQSFANILVHIVFSTKDRERWITRNIQSELHAYMGGLCKKIDCPSVQIGGTEDHVHLLCRMARTVPVSRGITSISRASGWKRTVAVRGLKWSLRVTRLSTTIA